MRSTRSRSVHATPARTMLLASALSLWSMPAFAQARAERFSDKDVKSLLDQVDEGRDKFEGNLDGDFKGSTLRGSTGETKVAGALQDYQDASKKLKDRFTADYSASAEVTAFLKQSTLIGEFMQSQPATMKGRSEWDKQVANLKRLAEAYGTTFPFPAGGTARRMNDKETAAVAATLAEAANRFKGDLDKEATVAKSDKDAAKKDLDALIKQADLVKSRTKDGKPATTEARQIVEHVAKLQAFVGAHTISVTTNWQAVQDSFGKLQQAFGLTQ
jgi:hypothetical protein